MEKRVFLFSIYDSKQIKKVRNEFFHFPFFSHFHESKLAHGPLGPKHGHYMDMSEGRTDIFTERRINLIDVRCILIFLTSICKEDLDPFKIRVFWDNLDKSSRSGVKYEHVSLIERKTRECVKPLWKAELRVLRQVSLTCNCDTDEPTLYW